jgi:two-component system, chemotaxis family, chemotaxis protein CheY
MSATVLIVDDAVFMRNILRAIIKDKGFTVVAEAASGIEAMRALHDHNPDIVLLDIILPDVNGLDLLESILKTRPQAKVVICSSIGQEPIIKKALDHGAKAFIQKPFTPEKVLDVLVSLEA